MDNTAALRSKTWKTLRTQVKRYVRLVTCLSTCVGTGTAKEHFHVDSDMEDQEDRQTVNCLTTAVQDVLSRMYSSDPVDRRTLVCLSWLRTTQQEGFPCRPTDRPAGFSSTRKPRVRAEDYQVLPTRDFR